MIRGDGFAVIGPGEGTPETVPGGGRALVTVDRSTGCRNLVQRVMEVRSPWAKDRAAVGSEEVGYVVAGTGALRSAGQHLALRPGTGFLVPPGTSFRLEPDDDPLQVISVLCPPPEESGSAPPGEPRPCVVVPESEREPLPAGGSRYFKLLIDPVVGCKGVTQFLGFIEQSRAPEHVHTYEEVIRVLDGAGTLHAAGERIPFVRDSSIFLAPDTPHSLENGTTATLRLLGVFSPAGSPADKREQ